MSQLKIKDGNSWIDIPAGGVGVPSGGNQGDILVKSSSTDYATEWQPFPIAMKLLWTNPNPTSSFAAQTVALDLSSYDMVGIEVLFYTTGATDQRRPAMQFFMRDNTFVDQITITGRVSNTIGSRAVTINVNGIDFESATYNGSTSNNYAIPLRIYGIKGIT